MAKLEHLARTVAGMDGRASHTLAVALLLLAQLVASAAAGAAGTTGSAGTVGVAEGRSFAPVYAVLEHRCGDCHVAGSADGPWSLDTAPDPARYPTCLERGPQEQLRCATHRQLVEVPAPGVPAWVQPDAPGASDLYLQACDVARSFHLGHSLPATPPAADCELLLDWISSGARY